MKAVRQKHMAGCAVACVAVVLETSYSTAIKSFDKGQSRVKLRGFYCREITNALRKNGFNYSYKYIRQGQNYEFPDLTIIFIERSARYPFGHYICKTPNGFMDPWINFPDLKIRAGFRKKLPGRPIYMIQRKTALSAVFQ